MDRREALKTMGLTAVGMGIPLSIPLKKILLKPIAYILITDSDYFPKEPFRSGGNESSMVCVNRAWHVYWNHHPKAKEKFEGYDRRWHKNIKEVVIYQYEDFPVQVRKVVELKCPLAPSITSYEQFHVFRTYPVINGKIDLTWDENGEER